MKDTSLWGARFRHYAILLVVSLLSMLFATGVIYFFVRENLIDQSVEDTVSGLQTVMESHVSVFEQADAVLSTVAADKDIMNLLDLIDQGKYTESYRSYLQLESIARQYDFIDYVSVYDLDRQRVMATRWGLSAVQEYPRENVPKLENKGGDRILRIDVIKDGVEEGRTTLRVGRYFPMGYIYQPKSYISLTLSTDNLMQIFNRLTPEDGEFFLMDEKQTIIYSSVPVPEEASRSAVDFWSNSDNVAITNIRLDGEDQLLVHVYAKGYGLCFNYRIPMRVVTADARFLINILSILFAVIILFLSVAGIYSIRTLFRPIERIRDVVALYEPGGSLAVSVGDLVQHIQKVYDEYQNMEKRFDQYKQSQKESFLRQLLSHPPDGSQCESQLGYFQLPFPVGGHYSVAVLSLDQETKLDAPDVIQNWELFAFCVLQTLRDTLSAFVLTESIIGDENDRYLIFCAKGKPDWAELTGLLTQTITVVHQKVTADVGLRVTIGLSIFQEGLRLLPVCRRQAETARDQRWLNGMNQVIVYEVTEGDRQIRYPYEIEKHLLTAFKANQQQTVEECLSQFHLYVLQNTEKDVEIGRHYYLQLLSVTYRAVYDWRSFCLEAIPTEQESYADFVSEPTADKLAMRLLSLFQILFEQMEKWRSERYVELSEEIRAYIRENYQRDLSLDSIAEALKISSSHLRRVFHEETQESVKGYLDQVRIQKAKELLAQTEKLINDISTETGYVSVQTFARVFKKETGCTPGEYRRQKQPDT